MKQNETGQDTPYIRLFRETYPEIQSFFRSTLGVRILLILKEGTRSPFNLSQATGSGMPAILTRINAFAREGLIERIQNEYALTNSGRIVLSQVAGFTAAVGTLNGESAGEGAKPAPVRNNGSIDAFMDSWPTVQTFYRSWIVAGSLFALSGGGKTRAELRAVADCTPNALIPRIRWLEAMKLVREEGYTYALTPAGKAVAAEMQRFTAAFAAVLRHRDFWNAHCIDQLPAFALDAFGDLAGAEIIHDTPTSYFENYEHYISVLTEAAYIHGLSTMANPSIADAIGARAVAGVPVELIVSPELARELYREPYREKITLLRSSGHLQFRVTDLPLPMGLTITDTCISAKFFVRDGVTYDMQNGLFCTSPEARAWGEQLFNYYREHSIPMEEYVRFAGWVPEER